MLPIGEYLKAVKKHWIALLGGSIVVVYQAATTVIPGNEETDWWKKPMPLWLNLTLLIGAVFIAQFQAWLEMRRERDANAKTIDGLQKELKEKQQPGQKGPKTVGDLTVEHEGPPEFGYIFDHHCHNRHYTFRINERAHGVLLLCRHPLLGAMTWLEGWNATVDVATPIVTEKVLGRIAEVRFADGVDTLGAILTVLLGSEQPIELHKIETSRSTDPALTTAPEQSPPSSPESSESKNAST